METNSGPKDHDDGIEPAQKDVQTGGGKSSGSKGSSSYGPKPASDDGQSGGGSSSGSKGSQSYPGYGK